MLVRKSFVGGLLLVAVVSTAQPALAGDPWRYADRSQWPTWAVQWSDQERQYPKEGELVDAIRFELIKGYPVQAQDYMQYEDREFRATRAMSRAEFAAVLSRSQGLASEDAKEGPWFAPYVAVLKENEIIPAGASEDWDAEVSRREAGQWMGRAANRFGADNRQDVSGFLDVDDTLILRALQAGIIQGTGGGRYEPDRALLRVEAAVMLLRLARARNQAVAPDAAAVLEGVVREADRQATERGKRWVMQGYADGVATGGVRTEEFAEYIWYWVRDNLEVRQGPPKAWTVRPAENYQFTVLEVHDNVGVLEVCGLDKVYRASDPEGTPWFQQQYCGRQFMVKHGGEWLISAAADRQK